MATSVPRVQFSPQGFIAPPQSAVLAGIIADFNSAFGGGVNPALSTPQGQLATSETAIVGATNDTFCYFTNQVDPAYSTGRMQDAIGRIYFLTRSPAEPTVVQALCSGLAGVVIPPGALGLSTDGNLYICPDGGVIAGAGTVTLTFNCTVDGPIACPAGALNQIYQAVPGWDSIVNLADGVIGNAVEGRAAFEARRAASVAKNARGFVSSVEGSVLAVAGVLDAYVTENVTGAPVTMGGFSVAAHSLYVAAVGGTDAAVAQAIWMKKSPGCNYNGNTTVAVYDTNSGYDPPYPVYSVTFERPAALPILFAVNIANSAQVPANAVSLIQGAIIAAFAGSDGGARARIGSTLYASRYAAAVQAVGPWVRLISLLIGSNNTTSATFIGSIAGTLLTVKAAGTGTIAVGQTIDDLTGSIVEGTTILSLGTGAGGVGTYNLSISQTVSGAAFTGTGAGTNLTTTAVTGTIRVGDNVFGTGVPANTTISSQTSGTPGGAGVYVTNNATTSAGDALTTGEAMKSAVANLNSIAVGIAQVPTVAAIDIAVTLT